MAASYDLMASSLLCAEDNASILSLDDGDEQDSQEPLLGEKRWRLGESFTGFPVQSDECVRLLVERELAHLPRDGYVERLLSGGGAPRLDASIRSDAIAWIWKVHGCYSFGPSSACLAVNYVDRFLSLYELPEGKTWMTQLLSVACLSLAVKMEENCAPSMMDLQLVLVDRPGEARFVFEAKTIRRMELLVLSTLNWRMQAVTPLSFIDYFLHKLNDGNAPPRLAVAHSAELIMHLCRDIRFLSYRPSEIAAAVAVTVMRGDEVSDIGKAIAFGIQVKKEAVKRCYKAINSLPFKDAESPRTPSAPRSPSGVLEAGCFSCKSDDASTGVTTVSLRADSSPASKRRRTWR